MLSSAAHPLIGIDPEIRFGRACIAGTRISVNDVRGWLGNGMSVADIIADFPELTAAHIEAPYSEVFGREADFQVTYRLFTTEEGGRKIPAGQGIRWDIRYAEETRPHNYMVYPEFIDPDGFIVPNGPFAPVGRANMFILNSDLRSVHRQLIRPGTRGYFMEGNRRMGVWEVAEVLGLRQEPS
jgi:uncharacterized protein (DUF433 family)